MGESEGREGIESSLCWLNPTDSGVTLTDRYCRIKLSQPGPLGLFAAPEARRHRPRNPSALLSVLFAHQIRSCLFNVISLQ